MKNDKNIQLLELASSYPGLTVNVKCTDLIDAFKFMVNETKLQLEQKIADESAETYLSVDKVSQMLEVSTTTLWRWEKEGYLIPVRFGRKVRYRKSDIQEIINLRKRK